MLGHLCGFPQAAAIRQRKVPKRPLNFRKFSTTPASPSAIPSAPWRARRGIGPKEQEDLLLFRYPISLRMKARLLLSIADYLRLAERPNDTISLPEIKKAASRWSSHNWPSPEGSPAKRSREHFMAQAAGRLTFLNRLQVRAVCERYRQAGRTPM